MDERAVRILLTIIVLAIMSFIMLIGGTYFLIKYKNLTRHGIVVKARVVSIRIGMQRYSRKIYHTPTVEFDSDSGTQIVELINGMKHLYTIGDKIPVRYLPEDPKTAVFNGDKHPTAISRGLIILSVVFIVKIIMILKKI